MDGWRVDWGKAVGGGYYSIRTEVWLLIEGIESILLSTLCDTIRESPGLLLCIVRFSFPLVY